MAEGSCKRTAGIGRSEEAVSQESEEQLMARQLYAEEIEIAVLGCMLLNPGEVMEEIVHQEIEEADFFVPQHKIVFRAMMELHQEEEGIDGTILHRWFVDNKYDKELDILAFIGTIYGASVITAHLGTYLRKLKDKRLLREMDRTVTDIKRDMLNMPDTSTSVLERAESAFTQIWDRVTARSESEFGMEIQEASLSIFDHADRGGGMRGLPTGFKKMDELTQGWKPGELIVIGARPGRGKSALMLKNIIAIAGSFNERTGNYDLPGQPVHVETLEMTRGEMYERMYSIMSGVSLNDIMLGNLGESARAKILAARDTMSTWPLSIEDEPHMDIDLLMARAKRMKRTKGIAALFVDYLQLLQSRKYSRDRVNEVAYVTRMLKLIAMENGIPVIALAQLNRKDADKEEVEPHISHLKESGEIEQSANKVILLHQHSASSEAHRKRAPKPGVVCCTAIAAKQRNGKMGRVDLDFHAYKVTFEDADEWGMGK